MEPLCKNNTFLYEAPRGINMENCLYADEMYYGCTNLGNSNYEYSTSISIGGSKLISAKKAFYNAFANNYVPEYLWVYVDIDQSSADVDLTNMFESVGLRGSHPYTLDISFSGSFNQNKTVNLANAFKNLCARHVNLRANRGASGDQYLMPVSLHELETSHAWLDSIYMENLLIRDAYHAFYENNDLESVTFFDSNMGTSHRYCCKFVNNANVAGMLYGCTALRTIDVPDNLADKGSNVSIDLPVTMRPYNYSTQTYGNPTDVATQSLAGYSIYSGN